MSQIKSVDAKRRALLDSKNSGWSSRLNETLHFYDEGGARIVPVTGEYDISNASDFERFMVEWASQSPIVILDFSTTVYIDSTMLSVLMRQRFALRDRLRVVVPKTARVRKLFDITGFGSVLMVRESLDDALSVSPATTGDQMSAGDNFKSGVNQATNEVQANIDRAKRDAERRVAQ